MNKSLNVKKLFPMIEKILVMDKGQKTDFKGIKLHNIYMAFYLKIQQFTLTNTLIFKISY